MSSVPSEKEIGSFRKEMGAVNNTGALAVDFRSQAIDKPQEYRQAVGEEKQRFFGNWRQWRYFAEIFCKEMTVCHSKTSFSEWEKVKL